MQSLSARNRHVYGGTAIALHWLMALGIFVAFGIGLYMVDLVNISPLKLRLFNWHKWLGVSLFVVLLVRLVVKWMSRAPAYPVHWSARSIRMVKMGHWLLYALMLAVPTLGYLYSLAAGYPVVWFGVLELPVLIDKDPQLKEVLQVVHGWSAKFLMVVVLGHVGMAFKHHFWNREGILGRMVPGMKAD